MNQNNDLWSGGTISALTPATKSVFDSCPVGWRIPPFLNSVSPFAGMTMNYGSWGSNGRTWSGTGGYFPTSGYRYIDSGMIVNVSTYGYCWTGTPQSTYGLYFGFSSQEVSPGNQFSRACGFPVRCCIDPP